MSSALTVGFKGGHKESDACLFVTLTGGFGMSKRATVRGIFPHRKVDVG